MAESLIQRVYDLKIAGYDDSIQKVEALTAAFNKMDAAKKKLNAQLQQKIDAGDQTAVTELTKKIKELEAEMAKLKSQRDSSAKEAALLAKAEASTADALLKTEKATVATATAEKIRFQTIISQNVERQRQLDIEEKQRIKLENEKKAVDALEGSYSLLKQQRLALERLTTNANSSSTITFNNQTFNFDEAIAKIKQMKAEELAYTEQLKIEKTVHDQITVSQQDNLLSIQKQRTELETLVNNNTQKSSVISFAGQSFNQDEAIVKLQELRTQEKLLTEQVNQEKTVRQSITVVEEGSLNAIKAQRIELEKIISSSSKTSTISFGGQSLNFTEAVAKLQQLKSEEAAYTQQLKVEKTIHDSITQSQQGSINSLKQERIELENIVKNSSQTSAISFRGQDFNFGDAVAKIQQLKTAEDELTAKLQIQKAAVQALPGSYYALLASQKAALELYKQTPSTSPFFETVKQGAIDATNKVQAFNRTLSPDGTLVGEYKSGIINAFKELGLGDVLKKQRDEINQNLNKLKTESQGLAAEYRKTGQAGTESFQKIDQQLKLNLEQQEQMKKSLVSLDAALSNTGGVGSQISTGIANGFKNAKQQIGQLLLTYVGFQAVFQGLLSGVGITKDLSDQTTNLEIELGKAKGGADTLVQSLSQIKTRTTLQGLEEIANVAAKAGVAEKDLLGVTQAIDKVKVAFGKDFGDVQEGTDTFAKLISIFFDDHEITGERILKIGNSIRTLANETVASVPFINDFAGRMAGLKQISAISLPDIIGLGAGFEQFKQSAEVSSTALVRVIPKIAGDIEKFSKVAGLTAENFSKLINTNPAEALLKVSEGLVKNKSGIEEVSAALADAGLPAARITTILATLGGKADVFRERIKRAGETINDTSNIEDSFARKNENLAGTLDRISKKFSDAAGSKAFQLTITAIAGAITLLIGNLPVILGFLGLLAASWAVQNASLLLLRAQVLGYNLLIGASSILQAGLAVVNGIYIAGLFILNGAYAIVTRAAAFFNLTLGKTPIGLILTGLALLISAYKAFGSGVNEGVRGLNSLTEAWRKSAQQVRIDNEIRQKSTEIIGDQISKLETLVRVVTSTKTSYDTAKVALGQLIESNGRFSGALKDNVINLNEVRRAMQDVREEIILNANAQASASLSADKYKSFLQVVSVRQRLEAELAINKGVTSITDLTDKEREIVVSVPDEEKIRDVRGDLEIGGVRYNSKKYFAALKKVEDGALKEYEAYQETASTIQADVIKQENAKKAAADALKGKIADNSIASASNEKLSIEELTNLIKGIDEQRAKLKEGDPKLAALQKERDAFQARLDALNGKEGKAGKPFRGSRIPGEDIDELRDIDARANEERINLEKAFLNRELLIRKDQSRILVSNEVIYLNELLRINEVAIKDKLAKLDDSNAAERLKRSELNVELIKNQKETDKKIFDIKRQELESELISIKKLSEVQLGTITDDPNKTKLEKLRAKEIFLNRQYTVQLAFNVSEKKLEETYNQVSVDNEKKRADSLLSITKEINKNRLELNEEFFKDQETRIRESSNKLIDEAKANAANRTVSVLEDNSLSELEKVRKIRQIELSEQKLFLAQQEAADKQSLKNAKIAFENKLITEAEYYAAKNKLAQSSLAVAKFAAENEVSYLDKLQRGFKSALDNIIGLFKKSRGEAKKSEEQMAEDKAKLEAAIEEASRTIQTAISDAKQAYFDNQNRKVDKEKEVAEKRLSIEEEQVINAAQSEEEKESIHRQFDARREALEKVAGEKKKKIALKEMAIDFGVAVVKAFAQYGFPIALIPIAALTVGYLLQRAAVQNQQFAYGGSPDTTTTRGGRVKGRSHADGGNQFIFKGRVFEDEVDELNIIRTKNVKENIVHTITGTHTQIASMLNKLGGGIEFRPGAKLDKTKYETGGTLLARYQSGGYAGLGEFALGDNLKAPINPQAYLNPSAAGNRAASDKTDEKLNKLMGMIAETSRQTNQRIDKLQVVLDPNAVQKANDKTKKNSAIGTL